MAMNFKQFRFKQFIVPDFWKKFILTVLSVFFMGFFLSLLFLAGWGTDPYSFMNKNIASSIHLTLGTTQFLVNLIFFVIVFLFGSEMIGFGTVFNMIFIGYIADFFKWVWEKTFIVSWILTCPLYQHIIFFAVGILGFVLFASLYMNARMGLSPYDATGKLVTNLFHKAPFFIVRIFYDMSAILIGFIASRFNPDGIQGSIIGAAVMAVLLGPAITLVGKFVDRYIFKTNP